jgi:hypothetical protein
LSDLLSRLRDPAEAGPTALLVDLLLADFLDRPLAGLIDTQAVASTGTSVLEDWLRSPRAEARLLEAWRSGIETLATESRSFVELAPEELRQALEEMASQHYSPDSDLLMALLDRPPIRAVFRDLLTETLNAFGKKLSAGSGAGGALGALGKISGGRGGPMGGLLGRVGDVASAVGGELERQLERRIPEFVDSGLSQLLQRFVDMLCDPERAAEQAGVRLALLEGFWDFRGSDVAAEFGRLDAEAMASVLRRSLSAWLAREEAEAQVRGWLDGLLAGYGDRDLRSVLEELDLGADFEKHSRPVAHQALLRLFATDVFGEWLQAVTES